MNEPLRILILEDNPADAHLVQFELEEAQINFNAKIVVTEEDYIHELQTCPYDLILSDYDLPNYNGALALAEAKRRCPDTPFILVTGAVTEDRAIDILTQGAKDYVLKNRLHQRLVPAVRRVLEEADEHRQRKKAEEDLRSAALYSRTLIEASLDPLVTISSDGKVMDVNKATEEITGVARDQLIGTDFSDYFTEPEKARASYTNAFSDGFVRDYPLAIRHVAGHVTEVLYHATIYENEKGEIQGVFASARDVTKLKRAEEELRDLHRTLEDRVKTRTAELEAEAEARKKTQEALHDSEKRYRRLFEASKDGVLILDADTGKVVDVNPFLLQLLGYSYDEVRGKHIWELGVFRDITASKDSFKALQENEYLRYDDLPLETIDGRPIAVEFVSNVYLVDHSKVIQCNIRDITGRKWVEEALRKSEVRYRSLFDGMVEGFATHEIITDERNTPIDYRFLDINPAFERLTGLKRKDVIGKTHNEVLPGDDPKWLRMYGAVALTGETVQFENYSPALKRHYYVVAYRTEPGQFAVIFMDITARKQAEEKLRQSQWDLDQAQMVGQVGSWRLDTLRNILTWSDENHRIFGLPKGTPMSYETFLSTIHPDDRQYVNTQWQAGLRGEPYDIEHRIVVAGQVKWVREKAYLEFDTAGQLLGGFGITQDITARKQAEIALLEQTKFLEAANKELESFSYSVSHDLRAPLRTIDGYSRMILKRESDRFDAETLRQFQVIRDSARKMGNLIDDILAFSRIGQQSLKKEKTDMDGLVRNVWEELLTIYTDRNLVLKNGGMPAAQGDLALIRQVLSNLLDNAVKFTQGKNTAVIEVGGCPRDGETVYYVRDNGAGFDMQYCNKLFGVFRRLHSDEEFKGTGIGLALVKRIIERHGGRVWAEGKVDEGATFYFTLPTPQE